MVSSLWYEANLKVFKVIIHMPLLVHGLHPQILFGLVRALNVIIVPTQHIFGFHVCDVLLNYQSLHAVSPCLAP